MTERWDELKALFQGAVEQPAAERGAWIAAATADPGLRREVERLLHAHDTAGDFLEAPPPLDLPACIGPYAIEREIGRGGMGVVYLARDPRLNRRVALKALPAPGNATARERLQREARATAALSDPGIATVYAFEEIDGDVYLVSEYVGERTLRDRLREGPLDGEEALAIARQIVRALAAAHAAGIVHRDLKPENVVFVDGDDRIKLVDFGIAQPTGTMTRTLAGTPAYLAPEQLAGRAADPRVDLYAFGVILGEMFTGRHPLTSNLDSLPAGVRPIVARCLASDPNARYPSARVLLDALARDPAGAGRGRGRTATWWVFHQVAAVAAYSVLLLPLWSARELIGGSLGRVLFLTALAASVVSSTLRLHRWFAASWYVDEFRRVRQRSATPLRAADATFAGALLLAALALDRRAEPLAVLLVSAAAAVAVSFLLIEPATMRAAFRQVDPSA